MNSGRQELRAKAFDYLFDAVVVTDSEGVITDWNKGSEELYGYTEEEAIGQMVSMLHVPEDTDHITSEVLASVEKVGKWAGEVRMLRKDGSIGWIESMCVPIFDDDNQMTGALGVNRDITDRVNETERLRYLAQYDQLTRVPNRNLLFERVSHLIDQCKRNKNSFSLVYFDLNNFKVINDTKGHAFGDEVLKEVASRITTSIRKSDTVGRIGGDEFVLLLENTYEKDDIEIAVETLERAVSKELSIGSEKVYLTCSLGVAIYPENGATTDELLSAADVAMYKAKNNGLGRE